tara:strand:+ start:664 stop:840 length:177 start_codon:yes stop_codon:yes gene_type:complete
MIKLMTRVQSFLNDEKGATAIEYGLIAAFIAVAISGVVYAFGQDLVGLFSGLSSAMNR